MKYTNVILTVIAVLLVANLFRPGGFSLVSKASAQSIRQVGDEEKIMNVRIVEIGHDQIKLEEIGHLLYKDYAIPVVIKK